MESGTNRGIIDGASRVLEAVMARPDFKEGIRALLNNIDPDSSVKLARIILSRDIEVPLAFVSALPGMANIVIRVADEILAQVREKFPAPLLEGFAESLLAEIDYEALARLVEGLKGLGQDLSTVFAGACEILERNREALPKEVPHE